MNSVRTKFILAMLVTSLTAVAVVGLIAHWRMLQKFSEVVRHESFAGFKSDVTSYVTTYGSWENATEHEPFGHFARRRHRRIGFSPPGVDGGPLARPRAASGEQFTSLLPSPAATPPPRRAPVGRGPPFRFLLLDTRGRVLLGNPPYHKGEIAPARVRADGVPIKVGGKIVGLAVPFGTPNLSELDRGYLSAMNEALLFGSAAAGALAVLLGVVLGTGLSRSLRQLTTASRAMSRGDLSQRVEITSRDEVGMLADAFNRMSVDMKESHEKIREQAAELQELAVRDALTDLYNRRHFDEQVAAMFEHARRYNEPLAVVIGDIDYFKRINDCFSHAVGDEVLRQVAELLRSSVRKSDVVARYGGEEFVIAFPRTGLAQALELCDKLRQRVQEHPWEKIHPELKVTMSMGLHTGLDAGNAEKMLVHADRRLYESKAGGRNRVCYT